MKACFKALWHCYRENFPAAAWKVDGPYACSKAYVCSIGMVNVEGRVAYLACEDGGDGKHRFYEEANIHRWVSDRGTSPFTRAQVSLGDIKILELQYDDGDESSSEGEDEGAAGL